jgi:hypothetical protein
MNKKTMRNYKPRRPEMTMDDVMTETGRRHRDEDRQKVADAKMQPKLDAAYEASSTVGKKCGGSVKKYAKGGSVRGAGAATKGIKPCKIV